MCSSLSSHRFHNLPAELAALSSLVVYCGSKHIKISEIRNLFCDLEVHIQRLSVELEEQSH